MTHGRDARWALAALGSALLVRLSVPPYDIAALALLSWVPLLALVGRSSLRVVALAAALQGTTLNLAAHTFIVSGLERSFSAPRWAAVGAWALLAIVQGLRTPLVLVLVHLAVRRRCPIWLAFPAVQAAAEELYPLLFPWTLALQVHSVPEWLQAAALAGTTGVTLWLGFVNGLLVEAWTARAAKGRLALASLTVATVSWLGRAAVVRAEAREAAAPSARVLLGHAATPLERSGSADTVPELRARTLEALGRSGPVDLVVWPETVVASPTPVDRIPRLARDYVLRDRDAGGSFGVPLGVPVIRAPLLFGLVIAEEGRLHNSAALVRYPGTVLGRYDKEALVPVGESSRLVPGLPEFGRFLPVATRFAKGENVHPVTLAGHPIAVSICYEDLLPRLVRRSVRAANAELLVNLTSDAWFRDSHAAEFHLALAKVRAVEHRKYLIRATRDGVTAVVDSAGRVRERVEGGTSGAVVATVRWLGL